MKFIFTCGGTAGHINPALAVAGRLRQLMPDSEFLFIGAEGKMEMELVPRAGYEIKGLKITNISRGHDLAAIKHNLETLKNVAVSHHDAKLMIKDFRPDAVIGTGGYVCYPVLMAAHEMHIPTAVHESNAMPGLTTKMLADKVDKIMVGFEESCKHYHHPERVVVTGTPVRGEFCEFTKAQAKAKLGIPENMPLVVSVWGSLGSKHMNGIMGDMIPLIDDNSGFRLIHSIGNMYYDGFMQKLSELCPCYESHGVDVRRYIYDMPCVMAAADLILCRAGASTLSELSFMGKPVIIVPSPNVTDNHQEKNARVLERAGGAVVRLEGEFDAKSLYDEVRTLLGDKARMDEMSRCMKELAVSDAVDRIASIVLDLVENKK